MTAGAAAFLAFIVAQRLCELALARRNTARLLEKGAREVAAGHYPVMVAFHAAWIGALILWGLDAELNGFWLAVFALLQAARLWVLVTLGPRWTTRIIVTGEPLVARGPYRFMRHPNYAVVVGEIAVAPMVLGLPWVALAYSIVHLGVLRVRIAAENRALESVPPRPSQEPAGRPVD